MLRRIFLAGALVCLPAGSLLADFSYEQTAKITGGMMAGAMKFAGAFSKEAREPMVTTVVVKGNRMAHISRSHISIIDLDKETITSVNVPKKEYSVMTFADMGEMMKRMSEKMQSKDANADVNWKASMNDTGQKKVINGFNAHEVIMKIEMEGTDKKSGQKGSMIMTTDMWMTTGIAGYSEVRDFYRKMASKVAWSPGSTGMFARPDMAKGMAELMKESAKLDGVPVLQLVKMGAAGDEASMAKYRDAQAKQEQAKRDNPPPSAGEVAAGAALGRLGGLAGGLGGFGRRKKQAAEQEAPPAKTEASPASSNSSSGGGDPSGALMEMTTELTNFSSGPVDPSQLSVPAGFKQVSNELEKMK